jgi:hypothetical protein
VALGSPQRARVPILALLPAALLLVAGTALAQPEQALLVPMPPDFALAWKQDKPDGSLKMTEFVPRDQTVETWQQMITIQHFPKLTQVEPQALLGRWTQGVLAACPNAQISRAPQSPVSGHAAMRVFVRMTECGARAPESILAVAIRGADAMHMVQHAWRPTPPTDEQLQAAMASFDRMRLCAAGDAACAK